MLRFVLAGMASILGVLMSGESFAKSEALSKSEVRARQPFKFPVDPLSVTTMSDYDLSLLLFRNWFNYDDGRVALPDLVSSWTFDAKAGTYEFTIAEGAKWSDGKDVSPADLRQNLERAVLNKSTYGQGIEEVIDLKTFTETSKRTFKVRTRDGQPKEALFQRLGSIFLAVASPVDFPTGPGRLASNSRSLGPYRIAKADAEELVLERNPHFAGLDPRAPVAVRIRKPDPKFDLMEFLNEKTWENYVQMNSVIPAEAAKKLLSAGLPYWTRGYDRVSLVKPLGRGDALEKRRELLKALAWEFQQLEIPPQEMNVRRAKSLQPFGYPLFGESGFPKPSVKVAPGTTISVFAPDNYYGEFHRGFLEKAAAKIGVKIRWKAVPVDRFFKEFPTASEDDFLLISFGVADPEPTTWMGLLFSDNNFISFNEEDRAEFKKISGLKTKEEEVAGFKKLLEKMAFRGGYLPLFHFSTLSIGHRNLDFKSIRELDETVNFSKVIIK